MSPMHIRRMQSTDAAALLSLWERSVRATHHFLNEADIVFYRPLVADMLSRGTLELHGHGDVNEENAAGRKFYEAPSGSYSSAGRRSTAPGAPTRSWIWGERHGAPRAPVAAEAGGAGRNAVGRVPWVDLATAQQRPTGKRPPWAFKPAEYFAMVW